MVITPVETVPVPGYPDKYVKEMRNILASARPRRWTGAPLVVGVLSAAVALGLSGCAGSKPYDSYDVMGAPMPVNGENESVILDYIPLFEYGEGTGAIGCVAIAAPAFLSEEEAFAILTSAFAEYSLTLTGRALTLEDAAFPIVDLYSENENVSAAITRGNLDTDGVLELLQGLPVEFVSMRDLDSWHKDTDYMSSVSVYNILGAARSLNTNNPGLIVFYDPVALPDMEILWNLEQKAGESDEEFWARFDAIRTDAEQEARIRSEQLLREQVTAFVQWFYAEGC